MTENRSRFVLLCQQTLVFGVVAAVAASAAAVVELEILPPVDESALASPTDNSAAATLVSAAPVRPTVRTIRLDGVDPRGLRALPQSRTGGGDAGRFGVLSAPVASEGYATVGVTWKHGVRVEEHDLTVSVRTERNGRWSSWQEMHHDPDHAPDPGSSEAAAVARPGTDAVVVGTVDRIQVRAVTAAGHRVPADMQLAVVDPGTERGVRTERPAIETGAPSPSAAGDVARLAAAGTPAAVTPRPQIFSRAQWGADERLRDKSSLRYGEVHAAFVHHTVNANNYTEAQVPAILRGIYAYHTQSRGWSDVGYNFLVDRFGRIWEGRAGGVDRPVVGAHTLGYNEASFAMSAIGNFEQVKPSNAMIDAYGRLLAWKLSLHGVSASSTRQLVAGKAFQAINGHRDAGSTACPGRYLYARLGDIRTLAAGYQRPFGTRLLRPDLSGKAFPDVLARSKATGRAVVVRTAGQTRFVPSVKAGTGWGGMDLVVPVGDVTGDGRADVVARVASTKVARLYAGTSTGALQYTGRTYTRFTGVDQLVGVGDYDGNGTNDLVGRVASTRRLALFPGSAGGAFGAGKILASGWDYDLTAGVDDLDGDGRADLLARSGDTLYLVPGTRNGVAARVALPGTWSGYDLITGRGDATGDGRPDLIARSRSTRLTVIFPGTGRGGFGVPLGPFDTFKTVSTLALAGQFAGTKHADILALDAAKNLTVFASNGRQNLGRAVDTGVDVRGMNLLLNVGDWNGDGIGDFMARQKSDGALLLYLGLGGTRFASPVKAGSGWNSVSLVAGVGDVTGDGFPDVMGRTSKGVAMIWPGNGDRGFKAGYRAKSSIAGIAQLSLGLVDGDGAPDNAVRQSDGSLLLWRGNGPGGLLTATKLAGGVKGFNQLRGIGDLDGDGRADAVARLGKTGQLWLFPGTASGLGQRRLIGTGFDAYNLFG